MINAICLFTSNHEPILKRIYASSTNLKRIADTIKCNADINFIELGAETLVWKQFDDTVISFLVSEENEMYILALITIMANTMERMLGSLNSKLVVYHFKDVFILIDSFVLNGKVVNLDPGEILTALDVTSDSGLPG